MIQALMAALRLAAPASIGYFMNDAFTFLGKTFSWFQPVETDSSGASRIKLIYVVGYFIFGGFIVYMLLKFFSKGKRKGSLFSWLIAAGQLYFAYYHLFTDPENGVLMATILITLTTGAAVVTTQNSTWIPKYMWYTAATQLSNVKLTVQGDGVVFDIDTNGLNHCGVNRVLGQVTNTYLFRLANGFIKGKNVLWEFTNSAAQVPSIYIDNDQTPPPGKELYLQAIRQPIVGPGGTDLDDFITLSVPSFSATDYVNMLFSDGTQQANMARQDLQALLELTQNVVNSPIYMIDNWGQRVKKVNLQVGATQTAYIQRWVAPVRNGMINQAPVARGTS